MLLITDSDLYLSRDAGNNWVQVAQVPGALCAAVTPSFAVGDPVLVGLQEHGILGVTLGFNASIESAES